MPKRYFVNNFPKSGAVQRSKHFWKERIEEILPKITNAQGVGPGDVDGGLYVGAGGVGYMLWYLYKKLENKDCLKPAEFYVKHSLQYYKSARLRADGKLGFLLGRPGIDALAGVVAKEMGVDPSNHLADYVGYVEPFLQPDPLGCGSDEVLVGRAGYIFGALWLKEILDRDVVSLPQLYAICDVIIQCGRSYSGKVKSASPLMYQYYGTEYLGAAHGLAGILQALLSVPGYFQHNSAAEKLVKESVDYYLSLQTDEGNFPCATDEVGTYSRPPEDDLVHWCHGAPGAIYMLLRAHAVWKEQKYLDSALRAGECVWKKGLLKKGPGICHGVAGSGYVFLALYRATGDTNHLYRAERFGEFLFSAEFQSARVPDCPLSLYEGWSGTICFLADLHAPDTSSFPFSNLNVFN